MALVSQRHLQNLENSLANARTELEELRVTVDDQAEAIGRLTNFVRTNFPRQWDLAEIQRMPVNRLTPAQMRQLLEFIQDQAADLGQEGGAAAGDDE